MLRRTIRPPGGLHPKGPGGNLYTSLLLLNAQPMTPTTTTLPGRTLDERTTIDGPTIMARVGELENQLLHEVAGRLGVKRSALIRRILVAGLLDYEASAATAQP